jgi:hypothetical protein
MKKNLPLFALILLFIFASKDARSQKEFTIKGVMHFTQIEGGCWYLETGNGKKYEIKGSDEELQTVRVQDRYLVLDVKQVPNLQSVCMVGTIVQIVNIIDTVRHPHNPPVKKMKVSGTIGKSGGGCWYVKTKKGKKYELQVPVPKKYQKVGVKYSRMSMVVPSVDGECNLDAVIIEADKSDTPKKNIPKKDDPR